MSLSSRIRTQALSWSHNTPLPAGQPDAQPIFQAWHEFDPTTERWCTVNTTQATDASSSTQSRSDQDSKLVAVTWNVDAFADGKEARISALLSRITSESPGVDIVFLQEVSEEALIFILNDTTIRQSCYLSEGDATNWQGLPFATMTFLSKSRFATTKGAAGMASIGSVWRVNYPSRYGRDALCCDIFMPSFQASPSSAETRVRLVNVHLDSLPSYPSRRPQQLSIVASFLRSADCGLVAGDFNPVQEEDATLIQENDLVDAWLELHSDDPGFTWGVDGKAPFPPNRMDRVAILGLKMHEIEVMHPEIISAKTRIQTPVQVPWSDHSGLRYSFAVDKKADLLTHVLASAYIILPSRHNNFRYRNMTTRNHISRLRSAGLKDVAMAYRLLADKGIPSAICGVNATFQYGGQLVPLDIELVINDADQPKAFNILTSQGATLAPGSRTSRNGLAQASDPSFQHSY